MMSISKTDNQDVYRESYLRLLGYSRHIGDVCCHFLPRNVYNLSHSMALAYFLSDTADKSLKVHRIPNSKLRDVAIRAGDAATWQMVASVILPGYTIHRFRNFSRSMLRQFKVPYVRFFTSAISIAAIPFIVIPIDKLTDCLMDRTYRQYVK